jgi:hypothetical protein
LAFSSDITHWTCFYGDLLRNCIPAITTKNVNKLNVKIAGVTTDAASVMSHEERILLG